MPIDPNIYFQQRSPDIGGQFLRGMQIGQQQRQMQRQAALEDAYNQAMVQGPEGQMIYDPNQAVQNLAGAGFGRQALALQEQNKQNQMKMAESQLANAQKELNLTSQVLGGVSDQETFDAGVDKLMSMGIKGAERYKGARYSDRLRDNLLNQSLSAQQQIANQMQQQGFDIQREKMDITERQGARKLDIAERRLGFEREKMIAEAKKPGKGLTPGQKKVDQEFAKDYDKWTSGGADIARNEIDKLQSVADRLKTGEVTTGGLTGMLPDRLTSNEVLSARADVQATIMKSLREILGAQFTEKEGERIIKNTWNEADSTENNVARLERLVQDLSAQANTKDQKSNFFEQSGSLAGYKSQDRRMMVRERQRPAQQNQMGFGPSEAQAEQGPRRFKTNEIEWK